MMNCVNSALMLTGGEAGEAGAESDMELDLDLMAESDSDSDDNSAMESQVSDSNPGFVK